MTTHNMNQLQRFENFCREHGLSGDDLLLCQTAWLVAIDQPNFSATSQPASEAVPVADVLVSGGTYDLQQRDGFRNLADGRHTLYTAAPSPDPALLKDAEKLK